MIINDTLKGHFLNLYMIALSDHNFDEKELETIYLIGEEKGISKEEFENIIIHPTSGKFEIPNDILSKIKLLYDFIRVIWADQKIETEEKNSFLKYCEVFNFSQDESLEMFDWLLCFAQDNLPSEELEKEINNLIK
ncbi:MAG: hypothetical protein ACYCZ2_09920 [Lutibacter sp.]